MLIVCGSSMYQVGDKMERLCFGYGPDSGLQWDGLARGGFEVVQ